MAISKVFYQILRDLRRRGVIRPGADLLEIGQANYYGDMGPEEMLPDANDERLRNRITSLCGLEWTPEELFELAGIVYEVLIQPKSVDAIDSGGADADKYDLNKILCSCNHYGLIINHGTAEHIFNIANVFLLMHDSCAVDGLMIHEAPWVGWIDHGFYSLQPTLFYDLATTNNYRIEYIAAGSIATGEIIRFNCREDASRAARAGKLPANCNLFVALRKLHDGAFKIPMQGVYANTISDEVHEAWNRLR